MDLNSVKEVEKIPVEKRFTNKTKRKWTSKEIEELKNYISKNPSHTDEMIGNHLNRTSRAVNHQRKKVRFSKK